MKRRLKRCWETHELEIGHDSLLRRQADLPGPRLTLATCQPRNDPGRYFAVIGKPKKRVLAIPEGVEDFDQSLKAVFCRPNRPGAKHSATAEVSGFTAAGLILQVTMLWSTLLWSTSPSVLIPLSLVMGSVIAGVFFWVRGDPDIAGPTKRIVWVYLFVVVVAVCPQAVCRGVELSSQPPPRQCNVLAALLAISATEAHSYCAIVSKIQASVPLEAST